MLRLLYNIAATIVAIVVAPFFLLVSRGRARLVERLGFWNIKSEQEIVWFHGASTGEIAGLVPVLKQLREKNIAQAILVTATSVTGLPLAEPYADWVRVLPFDSELFLRPALSGLKIKKFICAETELWPGLLMLIQAKAIPSFLINARVSDYSVAHYRRLGPLVRNPLRSFSKILAASDQSRLRLIELGVEGAKISTIGNTKYDRLPSVESDLEAGRLRQEFFAGEDPVLVLGSLRPGEDTIWFPEIQHQLSTGGRLQVVVAPRHAEKFSYFAEALTRVGIKFRRWSERGPDADRGIAVVLLDTFGDLEQAYSFADLAFIGATLVDVGGHNPLEAAVYGSAVCVGPFCSNVTDVIDQLKQRSALLEVETVADVRALLGRLVAKDPALRRCGQEAKQVALFERGATKRVIDELGLNA